MAKTNYDLTAMFGELEKTAQGQRSVPIPQQSAATLESDKKATVASPAGKPAKQVLQGKQGKEKSQKHYDYGTKRTFPIPDDLWEDALLLMQGKGLKQVEFINDLIRQAVTDNAALIATLKSMRK